MARLAKLRKSYDPASSTASSVSTESSSRAELAPLVPPFYTARPQHALDKSPLAALPTPPSSARPGTSSSPRAAPQERTRATSALPGMRTNGHPSPATAWMNSHISPAAAPYPIGPLVERSPAPPSYGGLPYVDEQMRKLRQKNRELQSEVREMNDLLHFEREAHHSAHSKWATNREQGLQQAAAARLRNRRLRRGMRALAAAGTAKLARRRRSLLVRTAGVRLRRPRLTTCFARWRQMSARAAERTARETEARQLETSASAEQTIEAIRAEHGRQLAAAEEAKIVALERLRKELAGTAEEQAAAREAREREMRVEALAGKAMKRIQNAGILAGWTAWHDQWEEVARQKRMLAGAAARLARPALAACVAHWRQDWRAAALFEATQGAEREALLLRREVAQMKEDQERELAAAEEAKQTALERLRKELAGTAEEQAAAREAREREMRVEALAGKAMKRIQNAGILAGWTAWHDQWEEVARQKRMLAAAGARLARPALAACVAHWRQDWQAERAEAFKSSSQRLEESEARRAALEAEVARLRAEKERQLAVAEEAKRTALERLRTELTGTAEEQAALKEAREREARVEALASKAMKRIQNAGIIAGWSAWHEQWEEQARQKRMLAAAGARLARPAQSAALAHWKADWAAERQAEALRARRDAKGGQQRQLEALSRELQQLKEDSARQLAAAEEAKQTALERLRKELAGTAEEQAAAREAREREMRVEALAGKAMKRIQNAGILAGWTAWHDQWEEVARQKRMLAGAAARLARPALAACVAHWRQDWLAERAAAVMQQAGGMRAAVEERARELADQLATIRAEHERQLAAAEEAKRVALERLRKELAGTAEEQAAAREAREREMRVEALAGKAMKRIQNAGILAGWTAWHDQWEEVARQKRMLAGAAARLARPALAACVAQWSADWRAAVAARATQGVAREVELLKEAAAQQRSEHERELAAAAMSHRAALERLRKELAGTAEEQAAAREAREREVRVEALAGKAMKRIQNAGILAGWTAWHDQWEEVARQKRMLAGAAARLARPALAACMAHWRQDWHAAQTAAVAKDRRAERSDLTAQLSVMLAELKQAREEGAGLRLAGLASEDERAALRSKLAALTEQQRATAEALAAERERARSAREAAEGAGEQGRAEARAAAEEELRREQEASARLQAQMKQLLAEQRASFDEELAASRGAHEEAAELARRLREADEEIKRLNAELARLTAPKAAPPPAPAAAPAPTARRASSVLSGVDIDEESDKSVGQQLKEALKANAVRVIDLFREWDADGDGEVSRKEFHKAMPALGFDAPKHEIDALFDSWDPDGGGSLDFKELQKVLRGDPPALKGAADKARKMSAAAKAVKK